MDKPINLTENLSKLSEIADWFNEQESVDVEEGLKKVKIAAELIKESKTRLKAIENEFEEIKKEIDEDSGKDELVLDNSASPEKPKFVTPANATEDEVAPDDIPF